jgi:hypothetical protein
MSGECTCRTQFTDWFRLYITPCVIDSDEGLTGPSAITLLLFGSNPLTSA